MSEDWKQWIGRTVAGDVLLQHYLGGSDQAGVYLALQADHLKAVVKLFSCGPDADAVLSRLQRAEKISHPNLLRVDQTGRCQLDGIDFLYAVMEYAEENLSQVLAERALTPDEVSEMLGPTLATLHFLHAQGLVLEALSPADIMAVGDQLKLRSDAICRAGDVLTPAKPHSAPEAAQGLLPASDIWSLGMTIVEVLTQKPPEWDPSRDTDPVIPASLPQPFAEVARHCLRRDPRLRWSSLQIRQCLNPVVSAGTSTANPFAAPKRRQSPARLLAMAVFALLAVGATITLSRLTQPSRPPRSSQAAQPATSLSGPEDKASPPAPVNPVEKPSGQQPRPQLESKATPWQASPPFPKTARPDAVAGVKTISDEPVYEDANANTSAATESSYPEVLHQVLPNAPRKALNTIHGTVRVQIRVRISASGDVDDARFLAAGPSQYFARLAMDAARHWKFTPAQVESRHCELQFHFSRTHTTAAATPLAR